MDLQLEEDKNFIKNNDSNAVLCNNLTALQHYKNKKNKKSKLETKIQNLEQEIENIKKMLKIITNKI